MHTIFNVTTTLILLPFGTLLAKFATLILPDKETEHLEEHYLEYIKPLNHSADSTMGTSVISMSGIKGELERMTAMTVTNIEEGYTALINGDTELLDKVEKGEEYVDYLNKEISKYISSVIAFETNENDSRALSAFFKICSNVERISDHAMNICGYTKHLANKGIKFSDEALKEIEIMQKTSLEAMSYIHYSEENRIECLSKISSLEQKIDDLTDNFRSNQIERMKSSSCNSEAGIIYSEMLTDFERIGDHILNIGEEIASVSIA
jgi:phosphate:Na+ symporter